MEATTGAKWLELLSEMVPALARFAYMCNPSNPGPLEPYAAVQPALTFCRVSARSTRDGRGTQRSGGATYCQGDQSYDRPHLPSSRHRSHCGDDDGALDHGRQPFRRRQACLTRQ
jgi:hypothetical protein